MNRRVALCHLAFASVPWLASLSGCSSRTVFPSESAAKTALVGKTAHDIIGKLGAPDSVTSTNPEARNPYTESWKYTRRVREQSGELTTLNVYLLRSRVVAVAVAK